MDKTVTERIEAIRHAGIIIGPALDKVLKRIKPGVTELELDAFIDRYITKHGACPGFKKVPGYKHAICACTNDVVVHGIPTKRVLKEGDSICIDTGAFYNGYHTDTAETIKVGGQIVDTYEPEDEVDEYFVTIKRAMWRGIAKAVAGNRVGDISKAIQDTVEGKGYSVVPHLIGHGVGKTLHEKPDIPGILMSPIEKTPVLKAGMTLAIEVISTMGEPDVEYASDDGWAIVSSDGSLSAVFERTILVTDKEPEILTRLPSDTITQPKALEK